MKKITFPLFIFFFICRFQHIVLAMNNMYFALRIEFYTRILFIYVCSIFDSLVNFPRRKNNFYEQYIFVCDVVWISKEAHTQWPDSISKCLNSDGSLTMLQFYIHTKYTCDFICYAYRDSLTYIHTVAKTSRALDYRRNPLNQSYLERRANILTRVMSIAYIFLDMWKL